MCIRSDGEAEFECSQNVIQTHTHKCICTCMASMASHTLLSNVKRSTHNIQYAYNNDVHVTITLNKVDTSSLHSVKLLCLLYTDRQSRSKSKVSGVSITSKSLL